MSIIKEFSALRPDIKWYQQIMSQPTCTSGISLLQGVLEPKINSGTSLMDLKKHQQAVKKLVKDQYNLFQEAPSIYLYECKSEAGSQIGIWALTSLDDVLHGIIIPHEDTLPHHQEGMRTYRQEVGLEASPILLTYRPSGEINAMIAKLTSRKPQIDFCQDGANHRLWCITSQNMIIHLKKAFEKITKVYVADGHHRLGSAASMHENSHQFISTLYVSTSDIGCKQFHRLIKSDKEVSSEDFFTGLSLHFDVTTRSWNGSYIPEGRYQFGLFFKGKWYQVDLKPNEIGLRSKTDVEILQSQILGPLLGIVDPRTDERLTNYPADQWKMLMAESLQGNAIVFTLYPMGIEELIRRAESKISLPPKSTYILPKVPFGLLLYNPKFNDKKEIIT